MKQYLSQHGKPVAIYSDKHAVFRVNRKASLSGTGVTQFGRIMKELGIELIFANSPQAKGRIERCNRTLQDRLVKELRLQHISTIEEANAFLPKFIEEYNSRFKKDPKSTFNAHKPIDSDIDLESIFILQENRQLSKNLTFQYNNVIYQVITDRPSYALRKAKIQIKEKEEGSVEVCHLNKKLKVIAYAEQEYQGEIVDAKGLNYYLEKLQLKTAKKPRRNHPWRRGFRKSLFGSSS